MSYFKNKGESAPNTVKGRFLKLEPGFFRHPKIETLRDLHGQAYSHEGNNAVFVLITVWAELYNNSNGIIDMGDVIEWPHFRDKILRVTQDTFNKYLHSFRALRLIDMETETLGPEKITNSKIRAAIDSFNARYEKRKEIGKKAGLSTAKSRAKRAKNKGKTDVSTNNENNTN